MKNDKKIYFSDFFEVPADTIEKYGAFNISLINDLPLFIDPFLLFNSEKVEYRHLHDNIIAYIRFLRDCSEQIGIAKGLLQSWYQFPEVKQNWLGYSKHGNSGSGLGRKFAEALNENLHAVFNNFGNEQITKSSHLEKLCLIREGVGRDNISDFTTNLIKGYLLKYTEAFATQHIQPKYLKKHLVSHVEFNYTTRSWMPREFTLPTFNNDFILLTPKEILTKDDTWINKSDLIGNFDDVIDSIPNEQLRAQINEYLLRRLPKNKDPTKADYNEVISKIIHEFPECMDYFIKLKEETGDEAKEISAWKVHETEKLFIQKVREFVDTLKNETDFYQQFTNSFEESYNRLIFLKNFIEYNDGYKFFYVDNKPIKREQDLQLLYRLTWYATDCDVNAEVNNGRGPVDYKISKGRQDKVLIEFKLASNAKLKQNLKHQVNVYEQANQTDQSIKVILYFTDSELEKILKIFKELGISAGKTLIIIDARPNKISASNVKD